MVKCHFKMTYEPVGLGGGERGKAPSLIKKLTVPLSLLTQLADISHLS
jgi:hypothetical protein